LGTLLQLEEQSSVHKNSAEKAIIASEQSGDDEKVQNHNNTATLLIGDPHGGGVLNVEQR
jgi:hypothetical protein